MNLADSGILVQIDTKHTSKVYLAEEIQDVLSAEPDADNP